MNGIGRMVVTVNHLALLVALALSFVHPVHAQAGPYERTYHAPVANIKKVLQQMQSSMSGHLPALEGFAIAGSHPLDRFQRAYFEATAQVRPGLSGESIVRVSAKVTAWYSDPANAHSGYELLPSNGRIENDILDQLAEQMAGGEHAANVAPATEASHSPDGKEADGKEAHPALSAPEPNPQSPFKVPTAMSKNLAFPPSESGGSAPKPSPTAATEEQKLEAELQQLQAILKDQAHPKNLAAVKKSGTAVVGTPSLTAKPLFLASAHDEFEILNFNRDWVHVRISGLSRGWIWRNDLEMPEDIPETQAASPFGAAADLFHVTREETATFPGDWEPLRGKSVKVISVQKTDEASKDGGPQMKLEFAKSLFEKNYPEIAQKTSNLSGIVLIFDSADGGMIAATRPILEKWKAGTLSDAALWHACFFDPPETFGAGGASGSQ